MPWKIVIDGGSYCIVNKDTGKKVPGGCHPTRKEAQGQLKALYANASSGEKSFDSWAVWEHQIDQREAEYNSIGGLTGNKACANCQFFDSPNGCLIVAGDISPTGKSRFWEELAEYTPSPIPVVIVEEGVKSLTDKVTGWISNLFGREPEPVNGLRPVYVTKDEDGATRAWLIGSNNFWDRHDQIIPEAVQNEYVEWVNNNPKLYPDFQMWHLGEKSKWGKADRVFRTGNFTVATGRVDPGFESFAEALANDPDTNVSNGYWAVTTVDKKEFTLWRPWEFSVLNFADSANPWMGDEASIIREGYMAITDGDKAFLKAKGVPDAFIESLERDIQSRGEQITQAGVGSKEAGGETPPVVPAAAAPETPDVLSGIAALLDSKLTPLSQRLDALETGQKSFEDKLNKTQQELVEESLRAQITGAAGAGFKASEDPKTVVSVPEGNQGQSQLEYIGAQLDAILKNNGVAH